MSNGEQLSEDLTYGWSSTDTTETETTVEKSFTSASEVGFEFEGFSSKVTLSSTQSTTVRDLAQRAFSQHEE
jgi:hypothetical protein